MDKSVYDLLKEKLGDTISSIEVNGKTKLLDIVADWEDGLTKTKATNANWQKDFNGKVEELKASKDQMTALEKKATELEAQLKSSGLSEDDRKKLERAKSGNLVDKSEVEKTVNSLQEQLRAISEKMAAAEKAAADALAVKRESDRSSILEHARNDFITEAGKLRIVGTQADALWSMVRDKGMIKIKENEKGDPIVSVTAFKDNRPLEATLPSLCKQLAEENQWAISSSGSKGTNQEHNNSGMSGNGQLGITGQETTAQLKNKFVAGLSRAK